MPKFGATEILRNPDGKHYILVTKTWWKKFLAHREKDLTSTGTTMLASQARGNAEHARTLESV